MREYKVAVIGATGGVGAETVSILEERGFPIQSLRVFGDAGAEDQTVDFEGSTIQVEQLCPPSLSGVEIAFFCTPPEISRANVQEFARRGGLAIDLSSAFAKEPGVPLVLPEVNAKEIERAFVPGGRHIVASPSGTSGPLAICLAPLRELLGLTRVIVSTYQSASAAGKQALDELHEQTVALLNARDHSSEIFPAQIAFNLIPEVPAKGGFDAEGFSGEERAIVEELPRLLGVKDLAVAATAVFVPTFVGHAAAVLVDTKNPVNLAEVREALRGAPSVLLVEDPEEGRYPMIINAAKEDAVLVGRLRRSGERSLWLWLAVDNLRKGSALNAVQIAEIAIRDHEGAIR